MMVVCALGDPYPEGWSCVLKYRNISRAAEIRILGGGRVCTRRSVCAHVLVWVCGLFVE